MLLIFLDIDKVLLSAYVDSSPGYSQAFAKYGCSDPYSASKDIKSKVWVDLFDKQALKHLHAFILHLEKVDTVGIVISSDWRRDRTVDQLKDMFKQHEFSKRIVAKTNDEVVYLSLDEHSLNFAGEPSGRLKRGEEIEIWLHDNRSNFDIKAFFIFDDDNNANQLSEIYSDSFIHCQEGVLSEADYKKALELFKRSSKLRKENKECSEASTISTELLHRAQFLAFQVQDRFVAWDPIGPSVLKTIRLQEERRLAFLFRFIDQEWDTLFDLSDYPKKGQYDKLGIKAKCTKLITEYAADPDKKSSIKDNIEYEKMVSESSYGNESGNFPFW